MDVLGEVVADGGGRNGDAWGPLLYEVFDVIEAVVAGVREVFDESSRGSMAVRESLRADGPDGGYPGKSGANLPLVGEVEPMTRAYGLLDCFARFQCKQRRIADENRSVCLLKHGDWIGRRWNKDRVIANEFAKENLGVGEGTARGGVGGDGPYRAKGMGFLDDELNGANMAERGDGAARNNGKIGIECGDGDEAEVGASAEQFFGTERRQRGVQAVALGQFGV